MNWLLWLIKDMDHRVLPEKVYVEINENRKGDKAEVA